MIFPLKRIRSAPVCCACSDNETPTSPTTSSVQANFLIAILRSPISDQFPSTAPGHLERLARLYVQIAARFRRLAAHSVIGHSWARLRRNATDPLQTPWLDHRVRGTCTVALRSYPRDGIRKGADGR